MENNFEILERVKDDVQIIEINGELDAFVAPKLKQVFLKMRNKNWFYLKIRLKII